MIDVAKAAAMMITNEGIAEDYQLKRREITNAPLPQVVAPTTAGTGSEATRVSVLTNPHEGVKRSISHPLMTPDVVILDPNLTVSLPLNLTTLTGMDAFSHAIESAVSRNANAYTRAVALAAIAELVDGLPRCQQDANDLDARRRCLMGACLAGLAMQAGMGASHSLAPAVCVGGSVSHSVAVAGLLPHSIRLNEQLAPGTYDEVRRAMRCDDPAARIEELCANGGVDTRLSSYGFQATDWPRIREIMNRYASHRQTNPVEVTDEYAEWLYVAAVGSKNSKE